MKYIKRLIEPTILRLLKIFPIVAVTGPRQSGKSTLLKHLLKDYEYVTFDDIQKIKMFEDDPVGFFNRYSKKVIFDEVQLVPEIFNMIKLKVDEDRFNYGNFVVTSSSQFSFLKSTSESLAGRIGLASLLPFQFSEIPQTLQLQSIFQGGYPELVLREYYESNFWYSSYINTYLNKDLRTLANVGDIRGFRRFMHLLAAQVSQTLDMSIIARDVGVSVTTIKRWLSVLEASYVIFLLPPYYNNLGKRIVKSPKLYFCDTGLVSFLTGIETFKQYDQGPLAGALFENYIIGEIYKKELHQASNAELFYLRTYDRKEIDLIIDRRSHREWIEIKKSATFKTSMVKTLAEFKKDEKAYLLYQGKKDSYEGIDVVPFQDYLLEKV